MDIKAANFIVGTVDENVSTFFEIFISVSVEKCKLSGSTSAKASVTSTVKPSIPFAYEETFPPTLNPILAAFRPNSGDASFGAGPNFRRGTSSNLGGSIQAGTVA
jgi:hypothetical protein